MAVSFKYKLTQIACGDAHSAAIDARGKVSQNG
jgi:alpha-tubulin suppressor-like RCC1 family protein